MGTFEHWFGVTYTFTCPSCHRVSEEKVVVNSPSDDPGQLQQSVNRHRVICQRCAELVSAGTEVTVHLIPSTPASLFENGYFQAHGVN